MRDGAETRLPRVRDDEGEYVETHTFWAVHREMFLQICLDYASLPDPRTLTASEIRFFYDGIRHSLKERTKPAKKK